MHPPRPETDDRPAVGRFLAPRRLGGHARSLTDEAEDARFKDTEVRVHSLDPRTGS